MTTRSSSSSTNPRAILPIASPSPRAAPLPEGAADGHDEDYRRYIVASGPYMVEGSDRLDFSLPPAEQEPLTGFVPADLEDGSLVTPGSLTLVRNPSWEPSSDRAASCVRRSHGVHPRRAMSEELARDVDRGELDLVFGSDSGISQTRWRAIARIRSSAGACSSTRLTAPTTSSMNLAVPPFDDIHVRRAVNLAIDKTPLLDRCPAAVRSVRGQLRRDRDAHRSPMQSRGVSCPVFDPYPHDPAAARQEMRLSAYDRDGDGRCDVAACRGFLAIVLASGAVPDQARAIRDDLAGLGIELELESGRRLRFFHAALRSFRRIPLGIGGAWAKDFPNGSAWFPPLFGAASRRMDLEPLAARRDLRSAPRMGILGDVGPERRGPTGGLCGPLGLGPDRVLGGARPVPHDRGGSLGPATCSSTSRRWCRSASSHTPSTSSRAARVGPDRARSRFVVRRVPACTMPSTMSEHTERLEDLTKRIASAKEFL